MLSGVLDIMDGNMTYGFQIIQETYKHFADNERRVYQIISDYVVGMIYLEIVQGKGPKNLVVLAKNIVFLLKHVPFAARRAEKHFSRVIDHANRIEAKGLLGLAYLNLGYLHKAKKKIKHARACVSEAIKIFEQCDAEIYLKQAKSTLLILE